VNYPTLFRFFGDETMKKFGLLMVAFCLIGLSVGCEGKKETPSTPTTPPLTGTDPEAGTEEPAADEPAETPAE
jgi:hypothetical protein